MTIHATERIENVRARLNEHLVALTIDGTPTIILDGETRTSPVGRLPFVRLTVESLREANVGTYSATETAEMAGVLAVYDLFWPDGSAEATHDAYAIDRASSAISATVRHLSLGFKDYSARDNVPVAVAATIWFDNPETRRLPNSDGFARRQVQAAAHWFARHTFTP